MSGQASRPGAARSKGKGGTLGELQRLEATMQGELADIRLEMDQFVKSLLKAQAQAQARAQATQRSNGGNADVDLGRQVRHCRASC